MSAAIRAKDAKERARIAAGYMQRGRRPTRAFADCLEMGDGAEVIAELRAMAARSAKLAEAWPRYLSVPLHKA